MRSQVLATALFALAAAPVLHAQSNCNFFVDPVSGNDSNTGLAASPWLTVSWALEQVTDGDTIYCMPGTYSPSTNGDFIDPFTGAAARWEIGEAQNGVPQTIKLIGAGADRCIVDAEGTTTSFYAGRIHFTGAGTVIQGLHFKNTGAATGRWNCFWRLGSTSAGFTTSNVDIRECIFSDLGYAYVSFGASFGIRFHDNVVMTTDGIGCTNFSSSVGDIAYVYNNTFLNCNQGIEVLANAGTTPPNSANVYAFNNLFANIPANAIWFDGAFGTPAVFSDYNNFFNVGTNYGAGLLAGPNDTSVDPLLTANPPYGLGATSPMIDTGTMSPSFATPLPAGIFPPFGHDVEGGMRIADGDRAGGIGIDVGAYEAKTLRGTGPGPIALGSSGTATIVDEGGALAGPAAAYVLFAAATPGTTQFVIGKFGLLELDVVSLSTLTSGPMTFNAGTWEVSTTFTLPVDPFLTCRQFPVQYLCAQITTGIGEFSSMITIYT